MHENLLRENGWHPFYDVNKWVHSTWIVNNGAQAISTEEALKIVMNKLYDKHEYSSSKESD